MSSLPPEVADAFTEAAITVLHELAQLDAVPQLVGHDTVKSFRGPAVIARVTLLRDPPGLMSLTLSSDAAANLAARYLPPGTALTDEIIDDVAGEFANVISGQAKCILQGTLYHFQLSIPHVVRADSLSDTIELNPRLTIKFASEIGQIMLLAW